MADLLELLLNLVLEVVCDGLGSWAGWRFYVPLLTAIVTVIVVNSVDTHGRMPRIAASLILAAGVAAGVVWEIRGDRRV